jgi:hypothetical protein
MSRFEINPNTLEPYVQEPLGTPARFTAQPLPAKANHGTEQPPHNSEPLSMKPTAPHAS